MMLRAVVPCDAALCNLQAVDCMPTLPALIACPIPSVYRRPCPPAYLGGVGQTLVEILITVRTCSPTKKLVLELAGSRSRRQKGR